MDGVLDLWEGEYTYRCILTNDYESPQEKLSSSITFVEERNVSFDDMNNGFGWDRLPKSFMAENTKVLLLRHLSVISTRPLSTDLT